MNVKVKICGVRNIESAKEAVKAGADFLGFNFVLSSKRFINPMRAKVIIDRVRKNIATVGIFKDATLNEINEHVKYLKLDYVQIHGTSDEQLIRKVKTNVIKAFNFPSAHDVNQLTEEKIYKFTIHDNVDYILLDRKIQGQGEMVNLEEAKKFAQRFHVFLAGGLSAENISEAILFVKPFAVDVAGGIETNGHEDIGKIYKFIARAKGVNL